MEDHRNEVAESLEKFVQPTKIPLCTIVVIFSVIYFAIRIIPGIHHWHPGI